MEVIAMCSMRDDGYAIALARRQICGDSVYEVIVDDGSCVEVVMGSIDYTHARRVFSDTVYNNLEIV